MKDVNNTSPNIDHDSVKRDTSELIIGFLRIITQEGVYHDSMRKALEALSEFIYADRIYLLEQQRRLDGRFFEWCAEGVAPRIARIKEVSDSELALFVDRFKGCDIIYGETLEKLGIRDPRSLPTSGRLESKAFLPFPCAKTEGSWALSALIITGLPKMSMSSASLKPYLPSPPPSFRIINSSKSSNGRALTTGSPAC